MPHTAIASHSINSHTLYKTVNQATVLFGLMPCQLRVVAIGSTKITQHRVRNRRLGVIPTSTSYPSPGHCRPTHLKIILSLRSVLVDRYRLPIPPILSMPAKTPAPMMPPSLASLRNTLFPPSCGPAFMTSRSIHR